MHPPGVMPTRRWVAHANDTARSATAAVHARQPSPTITQAMEALSGTFGGAVVRATVGSAVGGAADEATAQSAVGDAVVGWVDGDTTATVRRS